MKGLRGDLMSALAVLSVPLALGLAFPREAIGFDAARTAAQGEAVNAIVFLDASAAAKALRAAKVLPRNERGGGTATDLLPAELPESSAAELMSVDVRERPAQPSVVEGGLSPYLPSRRAAPPMRISGEKADAEPPFSRDELLKLN